MSRKQEMIGQTVLNDYVIEEYLGSGSYGDVYKAKQTIGKNSICAAIKRLVVPSESDYRERLLNMRNDIDATDHYFRELHTEIVSEIAVMHQLAGRSSNIVAYFQNGIIEHHNPTRYEILIAMEYLTTLNQYSLDHSLAVSEVLKLGIEICSALEVCHSKGIMHRDIKESNIFVNDDGKFKLGDFGLAKVLSESSKAASNVGSLAYKAPEVALPFSSYDKTVDIYSLGIVLFKMFNYGRIPFATPFPEKYGSKEENEALRRRFAGETLPRPQNAVQAVAEVIIKACAAKPENRYQTAAEFKMALQLLQKELSADELNRAVDKPVSNIAENPEVYESTELFKFEEPLEDDDGEEDIFASHKKPAPERPTSDQEKDRILWAQALKVGTEEAMREYLEMDNPIKAYASEAWKWLDELWWKAASTANSVEGYEQYLQRAADDKRYREEANVTIRRLKEQVFVELPTDNREPLGVDGSLPPSDDMPDNNLTSKNEILNESNVNNDSAYKSNYRKKRFNKRYWMSACAVVLLIVVYLFTTFKVDSQVNGSVPAAPTQPATAGDTLKIGVSIANFDDPFLTYIMDGMKSFEKTMTGAEVTYVDAKEDAAFQMSQVENFITQGMQSIVIVPVNTEATAPITEACQKAGVNLVYVNRLPANLPDEVTFVGSNSIDAGIFQMEYLGEKMGGKGNIVIVMGKSDNEVAIKRTEGVKKVIAEKYPDIKILAEQTGNWSRAEGMALMENWLAGSEAINAVCANNDDMALGAIYALEGAGKLADTMVGGVDCTPDAVQAVKDGKLTCTVFENAAGQGFSGIDAAVKKAKGEAVDKEVMIPFKLVTLDNVAEFVK